jgi:hypothetical protein
MAAMAAIAATARTGFGHLDAKGRVALSPWLPWTPDVGREAIALLESGFRANAETAMRAAVRTDPARC